MQKTLFVNGKEKENLVRKERSFFASCFSQTMTPYKGLLLGQHAIK